MWEIVTWGDSPYKNVASLDALLELIQVGRKPVLLYIIVTLGWLQDGQARALPMETIQANEGLLGISGIIL